MTETPNGPKPSHSIFGMALPQACAPPTSPAKDHSSTMFNSTDSTTQMAHSSPPLDQPSWDGLPASEAKCNPRLSSPTSHMSVPCTLTSTSPSLQSSHPLFNTSYMASNVTMASGTGGPSNPSPYQSSDSSLDSSDQRQKQRMSPPTQPAALPTPPFSAAASSPPDLGPLTLVSYHPIERSNSSRASKTQPTSSLHSQPRRQTPSERVSPFMSPLHLDNQLVPSLHSNTFSRLTPRNQTAPSSANKMARHSQGEPSSNPSERLSFRRVSILPSLPDTASDEVQHPRRPLLDVPITRYN